MDTQTYDLGWAEKWADGMRLGPSSRHRRRITLDMLRTCKSSSVIDIGCGDGSLLAEVRRQNPGLRVCGVDLSARAIEAARGRLPGQLVCMDIERALPEGEWDMALLTEVLEHLEDDARLLERLSRACRYVLITVPSGRMTHVDDFVGHKRRYTEAALRKLLTAAGFQIMNVRRWGFPFYSLYALVAGQASEGAQTGQFGVVRRSLCAALYALFSMNLSSAGPRLFVLAKRREP